MLTRSTEDYLKHIYYIQSRKQKVSNSVLADALKISPASVSEMVARLSQLGWIKNIPYRGFNLTKKGEKVAVNLLRKHRLLEVFLQQHLDYDWDEVHSEAEKLEHVCSDKFINNLDKYLGYPKIDPHGDPIPAKNGSLSKKRNIPLSSAATGKNYFICKVNDTSHEILRYVKSIGMKLNSKIHLKERIGYDNSILIILKTKEYLISQKAAENIFVVAA
jgi:DtxR family Mn-dependent transcriptional regulator